MNMRPSFLVPLFAWLVLCLPSPARAQFDTPNRSFHNGTSFRLEGRHQEVACASCHLNGQFRGTPPTCYDCHWVRRQDDRFQTRLGTACESCHRPTTWAAVRWDHAGQAGVPLNASHRQVACESCHRDASFRATSVTCVSCHQKDFAATAAPNHAAAGFPPTCESCHRPGEPTWRNGGGNGFNHASAFPLVGVHASQPCVSCHRGNVFRGTARECVGCHQANYNRTQSPNHVAAGFPTTCEACHRPTEPTWTATFNHNATFALVGRHASATCQSCHVNGQYRGTARECVGCHLPAYNQTRNPSHAAVGFPTSCQTCHLAADAAWTQGRFNHTRFPLTGPHNVTCAQCHTTPNNVTQFSCTTCHERGKTDRDHQGENGYRYDSAACYACHPNGKH